MGAKKYIYYGSTILLVLLFGAAGLFKLFPSYIEAPGTDMPREFRRYVKIPPLNLIEVDPDMYRIAVGVSELISVALLILAPIGGRVQKFVTCFLGIVMIGALYTHVMVGDSMDKLGGAFIGGGLVLLRLFAMGTLKFKLD